jgi:putative tributyrin esterase
MALMQVEFYSEKLGMSAQADVILPQSEQGIGIAKSERKDQYPVLWLLHGASDDHTTWIRRTSIERYVADMGMAVITPNCYLSSYTNLCYGENYLDYITDELPEIMSSYFPISRKQSDNYIMGQSMGGYGALKAGLSRPGKYSLIGCFSSGNLVRCDLGDSDKWLGEKAFLPMTFGVNSMSELVGTEHDIYYLAEQYEKSGEMLPAIYQVCGTSDFLLECSRNARDFFMASNYDYTYKEASGSHEWSFWDLWVQDFLNWINEKRHTNG